MTSRVDEVLLRSLTPSVLAILVRGRVHAAGVRFAQPGDVDLAA